MKNGRHFVGGHLQLKFSLYNPIEFTHKLYIYREHSFTVYSSICAILQEIDCFNAIVIILWIHNRQIPLLSPTSCLHQFLLDSAVIFSCNPCNQCQTMLCYVNKITMLLYKLMLNAQDSHWICQESCILCLKCSQIRLSSKDIPPADDLSNISLNWK